MGRKKSQENGETGSENYSRYWKDFYAVHPELIKLRSNEAAVAHWIAEHPGDTELPKSAMNGLTNVKSGLRQEMKKKRGRPRKDEAAAPVEHVAKIPTKVLVSLEDELDKCLDLIGGHDPSGKITVAIKHARRLAIGALLEVMGD